ncbi:MAG: 23S rRNA (guanosine(2251)-2'-O)-methyltransferase RlmB [Gammaproteobacteria bacterium]
MLVYGMHTVTALLKKSPEHITKLYLLETRREFDTGKIPVQWLSRHELDQLSGGQNHQGVIAEHHPSEKTYTEADLPTLLKGDQQVDSTFLLILDGVQDPHNLGACLRTADAAGVHAVIAPKDNSVAITPTVRKVACGAAEIVPFITVTNLARTLRTLKDQGIWLYGADDEAENSLYQTDLRGPLGVVLGAEGKGLRRLTKDHCDGLMSIPMAGSVSSLNVSVATGICLFEAVRQRTL